MRKYTFLLLFHLLILTELFSQSAICSYKYRKRITFDPSKVAGLSDLSDFPVLIKIVSDNDLRTTGNSGHVENSNGFDIIFTSDDGVTVLNHQMESYTASTGQFTAWVKIPKLSTSLNTFIYMYYGNSAITSNQSSTSTWDANYIAVYHFNGNLNNNTSTAGLNGTNFGTNNSTGGQIDRYRNFIRSSGDYIDVSPYNTAYNITNEITVSAWIRLATIGIDQKIAGNEDNVNGGWKFGVYSDNKVEFEIRTSANSPSLTRAGICGVCASGATLLSGTWYYVVGQYSNAGDFISTYVNGVPDRSFTGNTTVQGASSGTLKFGIEPWDANASQFDGDMDEIHIASTIRSSDWILTEYNNQNSPSTFYSISSEPYRWLGTTNTNWSTSTNWSGGLVPPSDVDIIISNGTNQPALASVTQVRSVWILSGATLSLGSSSLLFRNDITNCGTINGSAGTLTANGTAQQNQSLSGSGTFNLFNLTVNNTFSPGPSLVLNKNIDVSGTLTLTSGIVYTTTTNILALGNTATTSGGSSTSFISGPITKSGSVNFTFPVGKGNKWRRASVTGLSASATFKAEYFDVPYSNVTAVNSPLADISSIEYWQIDRVSGTGNAAITLYWEDANASGVNNCGDLTIARWNGSSWDERPGTTAGGSACSGTGVGNILSNNVLTAFGTFAFGSKSASFNPLPVELTDFSAEICDQKVCLKWTTYSEINNDYFTVEKSKGGILFEPIIVVDGVGNSSAIHQYSAIDTEPTEGTSYYRLKQTDYDGSSAYSELIAVDFSRSRNLDLLIYPNPVAGKEFNLKIDGTRGTEIIVSISDFMGKEIYSAFITLRDNGTNIYSLNSNVSPGIYLVTIKSSTGSLTKKISVQ